MVLLVHHGHAVAPQVDAMRPLSIKGRAAVAQLADEAKKRGVKPDVVWHSGKLRARQTAEAFWRTCNPLATFSHVRGLLPDDPPVWIRDAVAGEARTVVLAGHMPHLPQLLHLMLTGQEDPHASDFPLNGCVALEPGGDVWKELWRLEPERE